MLEHEIRMNQLVERMSMFTQNSSLSTPSTESPAGVSHNHTHGSLQGLNADDHPQYYNDERHAADLHTAIPRVSSIKRTGGNALVGDVTLAPGTNITIDQDDELKTLVISSLGGGGIGIVTELPPTPSHGQTVFLYNTNYQYLATYHEPSGLWYRVSMVGTNYPWNNIYKPDALFELLFGDATKSLVSVAISTDFTSALRIKGAANATKQLTWTFTSGEGKFAIWVGCETESASYDWAYVYIDDVDISGKLAGTVVSRYIEKTLIAGSHTLKITYRKDGSGDVGYDGVQIYAVSIP